MKTCSKCGNTVTDDSLFCAKCGTKIEEAQKKYCSQCGKALDLSCLFCTKCGARQKESEPAASIPTVENPTVSEPAASQPFISRPVEREPAVSKVVKKEKTKSGNKQFTVIVLCVAILLSALLLPMFELQSGYIDTNNQFRSSSDWTLNMIGDNYIANTSYKDFANTLNVAFFIMILVALGAVVYFAKTGQKKYCLFGAIANLGLFLLFELIISITWASEAGSLDKNVAALSAGGWICNILSVVLLVYVFNENIFKQILQKIKK